MTTYPGQQLVSLHELRALRARWEGVAAAAAALRRTGYAVPAELDHELHTLRGVVEVKVSCLLCNGPGRYLVEIASDAIPHAGICAKCDEISIPARAS